MLVGLPVSFSLDFDFFLAGFEDSAGGGFGRSDLKPRAKSVARTAFPVTMQMKGLPFPSDEESFGDLRSSFSRSLSCFGRVGRAGKMDGRATGERKGER